MASLHDDLTQDHQRLDVLLAKSVRDDGSIDYESYEAFRRGILRHIGIEERILFREIRARRGDSEVLRQLHREHALIGALLVPPPTADELRRIREVLEHHNPLEEDHGGMYETAEELCDDDLAAVLARVREFPQIPLAAHVDTAVTRSSIEQLAREVEEGRLLLSRGPETQQE